MLCKWNLLAPLAITLIAAGAARAGVIVVEPDDFAAGTDISAAVPGVTLSTVNSDHGDTRVFSVIPKFPQWASTGTRVFGHIDPFKEHWVVDTVPGFRFGALRIDLDTPSEFFSIDAIANDSSDMAILRAFDSDGMLLAEITSGLLVAHQVATLVVSGRGLIDHVIVGGDLADTVSLDNIVIPEPAGLFLLALGPACLLLARRR